jgi:hypothetical protein
MIPFTLGRTVVCEGESLAITYTVHFVNGRKGQARLIVNTVGPPPYDLPELRICNQEGLKEHHLFAGISHFYPHGDPAPEDCLRHGVGTAVLETILRDARPARIMFLNTKEPHMQDFASNRGFLHYATDRNGMQRYFKRL